MTEAEYKRAIFAAVDEETKAFLLAFAKQFGVLKNPQGWTVEGNPI